MAIYNRIKIVGKINHTILTKLIAENKDYLDNKNLSIVCGYKIYDEIISLPETVMYLTSNGDSKWPIYDGVNIYCTDYIKDDEILVYPEYLDHSVKIANVLTEVI